MWKFFFKTKEDPCPKTASKILVSVFGDEDDILAIALLKVWNDYKKNNVLTDK